MEMRRAWRASGSRVVEGGDRGGGGRVEEEDEEEEEEEGGMMVDARELPDDDRLSTGLAARDDIMEEREEGREEGREEEERREEVEVEVNDQCMIDVGRFDGESMESRGRDEGNGTVSRQ